MRLNRSLGGARARGRCGNDLSCRHRQPEGDAEARVPVDIGHRRGRAEKALALTVAGRIAVNVGEELDGVSHVGPAVQVAADSGQGGATRGRGQRREVLDGVGIVRFVRSHHPVVGKVDPQAGVVVDGVGRDQVDAVAPNSITAVEGDRIARPRCYPADGVVDAAHDPDSIDRVAQVCGAAHVSADEVALEQVLIACNFDAPVFVT